MKQPILTVAFNAEASGLVVRRHDDAPLNEVEWPLPRLNDFGYDGACRMVGNAALRMLQRAHPDIFARYPGITPPPAAATNSRVLVIELIERSHRSRTRRYVEAIDAVFELHAGELSHTSLPQQWPDERRVLLQYPD